MATSFDASLTDFVAACLPPGLAECVSDEVDRLSSRQCSLWGACGSSASTTTEALTPLDTATAVGAADTLSDGSETTAGLVPGLSYVDRPITNAIGDAAANRSVKDTTIGGRPGRVVSTEPTEASSTDAKVFVEIDPTLSLVASLYGDDTVMDARKRAMR